MILVIYRFLFIGGVTPFQVPAVCCGVCEAIGPEPEVESSVSAIDLFCGVVLPTARKVPKALEALDGVPTVGDAPCAGLAGSEPDPNAPKALGALDGVVACVGLASEPDPNMPVADANMS